MAALTEQELVDFHAYAVASGLEVLVEVHDGEELKRALAIDAKLIGVNNRDLRTFNVDLKKTEEIAALFPFHEERVLISESGIWESEDALFVLLPVLVRFSLVNRLCGVEWSMTRSAHCKSHCQG